MVSGMIGSVAYNKTTGKEQVMKKIVVSVAACVVLAAGIACAEVSFKGEAAQVDAANGTIDAQNAVVKNPMQQRIKLSDIAAGQRVDVDGDFTAGGAFVATTVELDYGKQSELEAGIDAVDAAGRSYTVGSIVVIAAPGAEIEVNDDAFGAFDPKAIGRKIKAEGSWGGDKQFSATKIEIE
jgi:hypothetical protein